MEGSAAVNHEDYFIPVGKDGDELFLRQWFLEKGGIPVFCLHGSIENGKIFYTNHGKGFAPFLARNGYDVFVGDLRGRGKSRPAINAKSTYGQMDAIREDIPAFVRKIEEVTGKSAMHWVAHSWGGVLLMSAYARYHQDFHVLSQVYFGVKRRITVFNGEKFLKMDIGWSLIGRLAAMNKRYLPSKDLKMGADNEPLNHFKEMSKWISARGKWIDVDGFDYIKAYKNITPPPTLYLAGGNDTFLGHPKDVKLFIKETNSINHQYHLISKSEGHQKDYGHIDMLTDKIATQDIFPLAIEWFKKHE